ncbi:ATPase [Allokutzneria sp. A3M-2-11 16]|uniref:N-acetylglucosamine kinase n=1 Tax=Allokutzneria sp. A3M-2-11 16 TaxID=2962043 RepID=UPI0020B7192F|nr:BadF/BadG/BcrA/BcrD ATPase family protein [Allokutzneria sp. A3M-2-11 16]MCP3802703.1 ATPase [Allokutzneria sp. A3M-2-11 16]
MLVLGADCGGSTTRVIAATLDGRVVGAGRAGPGNPTGGDPERAAAELGRAVSLALDGLEPAMVRGGVVGMAGYSRLTDPAVRAAYDAEWAAAGLSCPLWTYGDAPVAFAAGTPHPSGRVLIAGTGAVAAEIRSRAELRAADGLGWLIGDEGSGYWIGREAIRHAARALSAGTGLDPLSERVCDRLGSTVREGFLTAVYTASRAEIAALAPDVFDLAHSSNPAAAVVSDAARRLLITLGELGEVPGPLVLAGGLLTADTPLRAAVLDLLAEPAVTAADTARAAAWLALVELTAPDPVAAADLHRRMVTDEA